MEKATIITYNNTRLFQKPIPVWDPDYTTTFTTRFRPIPLIDDYNPTYIDPDYGRDPYWDTELYNQDSLQFQYVLDDIDHYNRTVHENPPITQNPENSGESTPQSLLDEKQFQNVLITRDGEPDCIPLSTNINLKCKKRMLYFLPMATMTSSSAKPKTPLSTVQMSDITCNYCKEKGHMVKDCEKLKKKKEKDAKQGKQTQKKTYPECGTCGKKNHPEERCWQGAGAHLKPKRTRPQDSTDNKPNPKAQKPQNKQTSSSSQSSSSNDQPKN